MNVSRDVRPIRFVWSKFSSAVRNSEPVIAFPSRVAGIDTLTRVP